MTRNYTSLPTILLLLMLLFAGCQKEKEYYYNVPDGFKAYAYFKPGSYWIYLNEKTGKADCTYVASFYPGTHVSGDNGTSDPKVTREYTSIKLAGKLLSGITVEAQSGDDATMDVNQVNPYAGDIRVSYSLLLNPHMTPTNYEEELWNYGISAVYPEVTVNGNSFSGVYNLHEDGLTYLGDSIAYDVQLVKNIGFIKFRFYKEQADTTWSLVRWNIVQ